jgi:glutamine cyclotransferase
MDGFIRVVHRHSPLAHQLWQIYFPEKLLVEFEKGSCRIIPHHRLNGEMHGFRKDHKRLVYAPESRLDMLLDSGKDASEAHKVVDNLYSQFCQLLMIYEQR